MPNPIDINEDNAGFLYQFFSEGPYLKQESMGITDAKANQFFQKFGFEFDKDHVVDQIKENIRKNPSKYMLEGTNQNKLYQAVITKLPRDQQMDIKNLVRKAVEESKRLHQASAKLSEPPLGLQEEDKLKASARMSEPPLDLQEEDELIQKHQTSRKQIDDSLQELDSLNLLEGADDVLREESKKPAAPTKSPLDSHYANFQDALVRAIETKTGRERTERTPRDYPVPLSEIEKQVIDFVSSPRQTNEEEPLVQDLFEKAKFMMGKDKIKGTVNNFNQKLNILQYQIFLKAIKNAKANDDKATLGGLQEILEKGKDLWDQFLLSERQIGTLSKLLNK